MKIEIIYSHPTGICKPSDIYNNLEGWHILTVGEQGFSMLNLYAQKYQLETNIINDFAEKINLNNESGSLYPQAPISAVPRKFFRDYENSSDSKIIDEFKNHISDFINANNQIIKAKKILIDFHVTSQAVPQQYIDATIKVFKGRADCSNIEELAIAR